MSTSTLSGPATPPHPAAPSTANGGSAPASRRRGPSGTLWLVLHQNRAAIRSVAILIVLVSAVLIAMHVLIQDRIGAMQQSSCYTPASWERIECRIQLGRIEMLSRMFTDILQPAVTAVPVLIGMFLGGPLLAQEYERGTVRLVLTQSVSPRRWLLTRLAVPGATVLVATAVLAALTSWVWWSDIYHGPVAFDPPFQGFTYPVLGLAPVAWSLFGLALGVLVGQLLRRTVAAVLVSGVVVAIAQAVMVAWRPFLWPLVEEEQPYHNMMGGFVQPAGAWLVERGVVLADGTRLMNDQCFEAASACDEAPTSWGQYHPASHLVPIQLVEAGVLLVLTALVVTVVLRRLTRAGV
ncbi:ABC transporter permease [Kitasatospora purpeofusca]|uniref:ABC transporter permease n=1 Tax=Kitasatospora purpeofusca TaxID=67352 RepID=UPI00386AF60F|nr:ABC transporter permease [Kitasatospora purpeofusca]